MPARRLTRRELLRRAPMWGAGAWAVARGGLLARPAFAASSPPPANGVWLAGDFHCHTVLSHDVWAPQGDDNTGTDEFYTWGWTAGEQIQNAELRKLDFLAITDHNRTDALRLPEYRSDVLTLIPGYEHSLSGGHAGVFVADAAALADIVHDPDGSNSFGGDAGVTRFLSKVHALGGVSVLNHPFYGNSSDGEAIKWGYGVNASRGFDAIEVWNIGWPARHDTLKLADSDNYKSAPWWEDQFVRAGRMPAVGGSDNHWRSTFAAQGVGQPTTWVYAADRSAASIIDAVRAGRTFISAEPPLLQGTKIFLSAAEDWAGGAGPSMVGGQVRASGLLDVTVRVENGAGGRLRLISSGMVVAQEVVTKPGFTRHYPVVLPPGGWLRAEVYAKPGLWMSALTSPIYTSGVAPTFAQAAVTSGPAVSYGKELPTAAVLDILPI